MAAAPDISLTKQPVTSDPATSPSTADSKWLGDETVKAYPSLSKFKNAEDLAKSYGELEKSRGSAVSIPAADAKPEEWDAYYAKTGRPATAAEYKIERPKVEGLTDYPEALEKSFLDRAHKAGLSTKQAQEMLSWWGETEGSQLTSLRDSQAQAGANLKKEWGESFDENLGLARTAAKNLIGDDNKDLSELLKSTGMDRHPAVVKFFHKLAGQMGEKGVVDPKAKGDDNKGQVEQARADLDKSRAEYNALPAAERRNQAKTYSARWEGFYKIINSED